MEMDKRVSLVSSSSSSSHFSLNCLNCRHSITCPGSSRQPLWWQNRQHALTRAGLEKPININNCLVSYLSLASCLTCLAHRLTSDYARGEGAQNGTHEETAWEDCAGDGLGLDLKQKSTKYYITKTRFGQIAYIRLKNKLSWQTPSGISLFYHRYSCLVRYDSQTLHFFPCCVLWIYGNNQRSL